MRKLVPAVFLAVLAFGCFTGARAASAPDPNPPTQPAPPPDGPDQHHRGPIDPFPPPAA